MTSLFGLANAVPPALGYASGDHECNIVALLSAAELTDGVDDGVLELLNRELKAVLDEEIRRLPKNHRAAFIACRVDGMNRRRPPSSIPRGAWS